MSTTASSAEKRARPTAYAMRPNYQKNSADGTPM